MHSDADADVIARHSRADVKAKGGEQELLFPWLISLVMSACRLCMDKDRVYERENYSTWEERAAVVEKGIGIG